MEAVVTVQAGKDEKLTYKSGNQMQEVSQRSPDSGVTAPQVSVIFSQHSQATEYPKVVRSNHLLSTCILTL